MLLPALRRARMTAKSISCLSNQKQIGAAFYQYADDYNGYLNPPNGFSWDWLSSRYLGPYLGVNEVPNNFKNYPITFCPTLDSLDNWRPGYQASTEVICWPVLGGAPYAGLRLGRVINPSRVSLVVCGDGTQGGYSRYYIRSGYFGWDNHPSKSCNVLYVDGSAKNFVFKPNYAYGVDFLKDYQNDPVIITYNQ
jgi:prepilin-type processing-associated H-X9-DG protein